MPEIYYTAPSDEVFEEVKAKAIEVWETYDNTHGYVDEKVNKIKDAGNIKDNVMFIVAMFDINNQAKLAVLLSSKTRQAVRERMVDGGQPLFLIPF